ncbi:putative RER1 protein [Toxoplasma gondii TgCatPRC2]|uniref:RER1 protein, putative n=15 Tax=Toxoplasma gondii TaxID=5811 RepID=A0A125YZA5_TOXGM|nr:RER1 protein, putative [Toxoplasma gondii ME49]EPR59845.1 putative RER1 protein [Toxoplasma gondii GT1]ESS33890.1 putative RER1 protein [Toxoplasma gondii VEG]KAF4644559.1 putative RER1 protein [Toxoplasma gondii]KFG30948.1 putative RER1 protein [Toxoplasma gondii p89]KFG41539.1 putative RER1 protein [Toxoplasma gondii FOU]KFG42196.1 putative RER1 protein [Toxoplasma gondii GAB2-2007-GAL-DOM2]KFG62861.1 putative RER1 protein [Toxoplasma gondii RUB]KFH00015.1 putative RER1 protein [Toxopl|eukprot:XP_018636466.1 RER1 protein, putative [Toxoplasma gondii ME49]
MMASTSAQEDLVSAPFSSRLFRSLSRLGSSYLDATTLYPKTRWLAFFLLLALYVVRVYMLAGFFVVTYGLGIYLLNLLIGFISPQIDPETDEFVLPVRESEEYRPFQRQLPEFKCWLAGTRAVLISVALTFFSVFDLPVFWPILLVYFILLFVLTMKEQIKRMIKYKYLPFSWGKQTYGDITRGKADRARGETQSWRGAAAAGVASAVSMGQEHLTTPYVLR